MRHHKIYYYKFAELLKISLYKICLRCQLLCEEFVLHFCFKSNTSDISFQNRYLPEFDTLQLRIADDIDKILLNQKVKIFGHIYNLNYYLQDPITLKMWPSDVFFYKSKTKICGYGDVKYVLELNKLNHLVDAAKLYKKTKDEKFITYLYDELTKWQTEVHYEHGVVNKIIMDIAFRSINLIYISIYCGDNKYFANNIYPQIHCLLKLYERQIRKFSTPKWFKTGNGANHVIGEMVGVIILQKWIAKVENKSINKSYLNEEYFWLYETLDKLIPKSGVYLENSANYARLVSEFLVVLDMFEVYFGTANTKLRSKYLIPILNYILSISYNGNLPNFGDNDAATILTPFKTDFDDITPLLKYREIINAALPDLNQYQQDGNFIWKSDTPLDISIFIRFGKWSIFRPGAISHSHCDLLSIIMSAKGCPIFVDKGCSFYNLSLDIKKEYLSTAAHNTISFDNLEQADYNNGWYNYPESGLLENKDSSNIFSGYIKYKNKEHIRYLYLNYNVLTIIDEIHCNNDTSARINYILDESIVPQKNGNNTFLLSLKTGDIVKIEFSGVNIELSETEYFPHYANICKSYAFTGELTSRIVKTIITF